VGEPITLSLEEKIVLQKVNGLPPLSWLLTDCKTEDRQQHWMECKQFFQFLHALLRDYFSARETNWLDLPLKDREFWISYRDSWLKLYGLILDNFTCIKEAADRDGITIPTQPGEFFLEILNWEAAAFFYPCVEAASPDLGRFSPRKEYQTQTTLRKQRQSIKAEYQRWQKAKTSGHTEEWAFDAYKTYCLVVLSGAAKKDKSLAKKLKEYARLNAEMQTDLMKMIHPRNRVQGYQWVNGERRQLPRG
jgi:hypothetical protein